MWKVISIFISVVIASSTTASAQQVENKSLTVSYNKTTSLIFPFSITSVDRGSKDVLAQKARGVENVLQVKAGRKDFSETNLTVITADGVLHQFTVSYSESPSAQAMTITANQDEKSLILAKDAINERNIQADARIVLSQKVTGKIDQAKAHQMVLSLQDIFIRENILYYRILIRNKSSINYDVKSLKFLIRDRKKVKRTSSQEVEIVPQYVGNKTESINGYASRTMIYAVRKFTIPDGKALHINLFEENGGRNLYLRIDNKDILKAKMLPVTKNLLTIN
jgi:conjugative transposon TraN protein